MEENFRLLKPFLRGLPIIVLSMVLSVIVAKKYLSYVTPMYESTTKLKLADVSEGVPNSNLFKDFDVFATSNKIAAEIELIKSDLLINKALDQLDFDTEIYRSGKIRNAELYRDSPILIDECLTDPGMLDRTFKLIVSSREAFTLTLPDADESINGRFGENINIGSGHLRINLNEQLLFIRPDISVSGSYEFSCLSRSKLVGKISKDIDVKSVDDDVAVIRISVKSAVPEKAAVLVNMLTETYITDYIETKYKAAETTVKFLDNQIDDVNARLSESENNIESYRDRNNIVNIRQETETDLRKISQLKIQQTNVLMNLRAIEQLDDYMESGKDNFLELAPNFEAFTDLLSTEIIKSIKLLQAEKKDLLLVYTPEEERIKVVERKIEDLTSYLIESISNTRRNLEVKFEQLSADIESAESVFTGIPEKERLLTIMNREFEIYQQSFNFLNEKKIEAEIAQAARISFHRILSFATPSKDPVSPNRTIIVIVSAILGLFGAIVFIYIVHLSKAKVNDAYAIERNSSLPIAVQTPYLNQRSKIDSHFLKEAIQLELKGIMKQDNIVTLSSFNNNEGRAFHAWNLLKALQEQGRRVLLLDVEGNLAHIGGQDSSGAGQFQYLKLSRTMTPTSKDALNQLLTRLKTDHDVIIINNECIERESSGLLFMSAAQANLFVLDARRTAAKQITRTEILAQEFNLPEMWFVLNKAGYNPNILTEIYGWVKKFIVRPNRQISAP